jgi:hypothetical protein
MHSSSTSLFPYIHGNSSVALYEIQYCACDTSGFRRGLRPSLVWNFRWRRFAGGYCRYRTAYQSRGIGCLETLAISCQTMPPNIPEKQKASSAVYCATQKLPATTHKSLLSYWTYLQAHESKRNSWCLFQQGRFIISQ